jgi:hypothetical protein
VGGGGGGVPAGGGGGGVSKNKYNRITQYTGEMESAALANIKDQCQDRRNISNKRCEGYRILHTSTTSFFTSKTSKYSAEAKDQRRTQ